MTLEELIKINNYISHRSTLTEESEKIQPKRLQPTKIPGLKIESNVSAATGIHVVFGRNNAGKTRFLKSIENSLFQTHIKPTDLPPQYQNHLRQDLRLDSFLELPAFEITWPRMLSNRQSTVFPRTDEIKVNLEAIILDSDEQIEANKLHAKLTSTVSGNLAFRPAILIPTNRHIRSEGNLGTNMGDIGDINRFAPLLDSLNRDYETRGVFRTITDSFAEITDGLKIDFQGKLADTNIFIQEGNLRPQSLDDCGDGLRDLLYIITHVALFSEHDLLIDEPGQRLHPHAQRKLLHYFERSSKKRAIWLASHDGVFVGGASVGNRYSVTRTTDSATSSIERLPDPEELRVAFYQLGWSPQDALLKDHVIYCEGPADKEAFEEIILHLSHTDARYGGTVVVDLGGEGAVWGKAPQIIKNIGLLRQAVPHARHTAILDKGSRTERELEGKSKSIQDKGTYVYFLKRNELENYFLAPALITALLDEHLAKLGTQRQETASGAAILKQLSETDLVNNKGSEILSGIFRDFLNIDYPKVDGAKWIRAFWHKYAPDLFLELASELQIALRHDS